MITEEDKLILEFCGWRYDSLECECPVCSVSCWIKPHTEPDQQGHSQHSIAPDLNIQFYFDYAFPKLDRAFFEINNEYLGKKRNKVRILYRNSFYDGMDEDPAEASRQALISLIKGEETIE